MKTASLRKRSPFFFLALALFASLAGCDLQPKSVPCGNAGDCQAASARYSYCVQSRCVECLEDSGCGEGNRCKNGMCERRCQSARDCPTGHASTDGLCGG